MSQTEFRSTVNCRHYHDTECRIFERPKLFGIFPLPYEKCQHLVRSCQCGFRKPAPRQGPLPTKVKRATNHKWKICTIIGGPGADQFYKRMWHGKERYWWNRRLKLDEEVTTGMQLQQWL